MSRDLYNSIDVSRAESPIAAAQTDNTAIVTEIIDMRGYESLVFACALGTLADSDATFAALLEHGDDSGLSDNTAVADVGMDPTESTFGFDFADDNSVRKIGYVGGKRYVRLTITPSGNSGAVPIAVIAIRSHTNMPTTVQAS